MWHDQEMAPGSRHGLRIALIIYGSLDSQSGGYLYDRELVRGLEQRGHNVEVVTRPWRNYLRHVADNLSPAWWHRVRSLSADLILQDELNHPSLAVVNLRRRRMAPPVVSIVHHLRSSEQHAALLKPLYRFVERIYLRSVDAFIFNSKTTESSVESMLGQRNLLGIVAYPAGDHVLSAGHFASLHESEPGVLVVLFVGNLIPRKRLHIVIEALASMSRPVLLHVAGSEEFDPVYARHIRALAARLGVSAQVRLHGAVTDDTRARLYAGADVLAVPSYEGFGIVYLEAMAFGCPVIAAAAGAAHEIVTNGVDGFLVPLDDARAVARSLELLAGDAALLERMRKLARKRYARHPTWDETVSQITTWLEGLCQ